MDPITSPSSREFPEHREAIRRLKGTNEHFRQMFERHITVSTTRSIASKKRSISGRTRRLRSLNCAGPSSKDYIYHLILPRVGRPAAPPAEGILASRADFQCTGF